MMESRFLWSVRLFEMYKNSIWRVQRLWVKSQISRRCRVCAASEKMLVLNSDHICSLCAERKNKESQDLNQQNESQKMVEEFHQILRKTRGEQKYDALVLFSGGKDSTYMIRQIRNEFPQIRMLAITIHNGFMSPIAEENVQKLIVPLDIDHIFVRMKKTFHAKLFRYGLTHIKQKNKGAYEIVDFSDGEFILDTARNIAAQFKIPLILCGYSRYQIQDGFGLNTFEFPHAQQTQDRQFVSDFPLTDIFSPEEISYWWQGSKWSMESIPRILFPLYAWNLTEDEIKTKVMKWGLLPKNSHQPALTNHRLIPLFGIVDVHQRGYSSFEPEFCRMIREGKANVDEWRRTFELLEYTAKTGLFVRPLVEELLSELELTKDDVGISFR